MATRCAAAAIAAATTSSGGTPNRAERRLAVQAQSARGNSAAAPKKNRPGQRQRKKNRGINATKHADSHKKGGSAGPAGSSSPASGLAISPANSVSSPASGPASCPASDRGRPDELRSPSAAAAAAVVDTVNPIPVWPSPSPPPPDDGTGVQRCLQCGEEMPDGMAIHWRTCTALSRAASSRPTSSRGGPVSDPAKALRQGLLRQSSVSSKGRLNGGSTINSEQTVSCNPDRVCQVVGTRGSVIKELMQVTSAHIQLQADRKFPTFTIIGQPAAVKDAAERVRYIAEHGAAKYKAQYAAGGDGRSLAEQAKLRASNTAKAAADAARRALPPPPPAHIKNDVKDIDELLKRGGWKYVSTTKHARYQRELGFGAPAQNVWRSVSPSDVRYWLAFRAKLRRLDDERAAWIKQKSGGGSGDASGDGDGDGGDGDGSNQPRDQPAV
jgi:hypothetical protein